MDTAVLERPLTTPATQRQRTESPAMEALKRRLRVFERAHAFEPTLPPGLVIERATTQEDLEQAYRLVHDSYVDAGYIDPHPSGLRVRAVSALPHCAMFVAKVDGRVVGTLSMIADSPLGLPMEKCFRKEIRALRAQGRLIVEASDLSVAKDHRDLRVLTELSRCVMAHALYVGADDIVIAVSPEHSAYFQGIMQFESFGDARSYSTDKADIVEAKRLSLFSITEKAKSIDSALGEKAFYHDFFFGASPYAARHDAWHRRALTAMRDPELFEELFVKKAGLLEQCTEEELRVLHTHHPEIDVPGAAERREVKRDAAPSHPVLEAFRRALAHVPAYRVLVQEAGLDPSRVNTLDRFRQLAPVLDRTNTFDRFSFDDLSIGGSAN